MSADVRPIRPERAPLPRTLADVAAVVSRRSDGSELHRVDSTSLACAASILASHPMLTTGDYSTVGWRLAGLSNMLNGLACADDYNMSTDALPFLSDILGLYAACLMGGTWREVASPETWEIVPKAGQEGGAS